MKGVGSKDIIAPVRGWNTDDALRETDAYRLENWFPAEDHIKVRGGFLSHVDIDLKGGDQDKSEPEVDTLVEYHSGGVSSLIAVAGNKMWDVSAKGGAKEITIDASDETKKNIARYFCAQFNNELLFFNGKTIPIVLSRNANKDLVASVLRGKHKQLGSEAKTSQLDAGSSERGHMVIWYPSGYGDNHGSGGFKVSRFFFCATHRGRAYLAATGSQSFWYSGLGNIRAVQEFELGKVYGFRGDLIYIGSWMLGSLGDINNYIVFVFSSGDVALYSGSDPGSAANFGLIGVYHIPKPVSHRGFINVGTDIVAITHDGFASIAASFTGRDRKSTLIDGVRINNACRDEARKYWNNFGWQAISHSEGNKLVFNVPVVDGKEYRQMVFNNGTWSACLFTGINAACFAVFKGDLYFGGANGVVYRLLDSGCGDEGTIRADCVFGPTHLGSKSINKQVTGVKLVAKSTGIQSMSVTVAANSKVPPLSVSQLEFTYLDEGGKGWGSKWGEAEWSAGEKIREKVVHRNALGVSFMTRIYAEKADSEIALYSISPLYKKASWI